MENGKYGLAFASGSATSATLIHLLNSGDHVISIDDVYGGSNRYFNKVANPCNGINFSMVDLTVPGALEAAVTPKTKMVSQQRRGRGNQSPRTCSLSFATPLVAVPDARLFLDCRVCVHPTSCGWRLRPTRL